MRPLTRLVVAAVALVAPLAFGTGAEAACLRLVPFC